MSLLKLLGSCGGGSVGKKGPSCMHEDLSFDLQNPCKTLDMLTHACNFRAKDAETDGSLEFSGQLP